MTLDDRNPSFVYTGIWGTQGSSAEFDQTTTWTNTTGSRVTIPFSGVQISVWGTIGAAGLGIAPQSSYSIDNGPATVFVGVQQASTQYKQCFFQSGQLAPTSHTLVIQNQVDGGYYWLDYVTVVPPSNVSSDTTTSTSSSTSSSSTHTGSATSTAATTPATTTTTGAAVTSQSTPSASHNLPIGPIVGGVLGALALIGFGIIGVMLLRRRGNDSRRRRKGEDEVMTSLWTKIPSSTSDLTPFVTHSYQPVRNNNNHYAAEHQTNYTPLSDARQHPQDAFDTMRSSSSMSARRHDYLDPFLSPPIALRDRLPSEKADALLGHRRDQSSASTATASSSRPRNYNPPFMPPPSYD